MGAVCEVSLLSLQSLAGSVGEEVMTVVGMVMAQDYGFEGEGPN